MFLVDSKDCPRRSVHRFSLQLPLLHKIDVNLALGATNARSVLPSSPLCDLGACGATPDGLKCVIPWTLSRQTQSMWKSERSAKNCSVFLPRDTSRPVPLLECFT